jgi:hypothetical protein
MQGKAGQGVHAVVACGDRRAQGTKTWQADGATQ